MGQRVLITAGASGIGLAMAHAFVANGAQVWLADIDAVAVAAAPDGMRADCLDVADEGAIADLFARIGAEWGGLDVVCANAGIKGPTARLEDMPLDGWRDCLAVNLDAAFLATKYAARMMKPAGKGVILYTSSTAGLYGFPLRAPYAAAKWGLHGLMKTATMELGPYGIRANAILPGSVEGPRMEAVLAAEAQAKGLSRDQVYAAYAGGTSLRSFIGAEDIAAMAVFLASDAARFVTGQMVPVDGHIENPDPKV